MRLFWFNWLRVSSRLSLLENLEFAREGRSSGLPADGKRTVNDVNGGTVADGADANRPPLSAAEERMLNQTTVVRRTAHMEEVLGGVLFNFP